MAAVERTTENPLRSAALEYARAGRSVFPCKPGDKRPLAAHWITDATDDPDTIRWWWTIRWPKANVAIPCGPDFFVIDIDGEAGEQSLDELVERNGPLPLTLTALTGGDGQHLIFSGAGELGNSASKLGPGIDTRGTGGYIIAAPSLHPSGQTYEWLDPDAPIAPLPEWIRAALTFEQRTPAPVADRVAPSSDSGGITKYARVALDGQCSDVAGTGEGGRNHAVNRAAFRMGRLVAGGQIDEATVADELTAAALRCGLDEKEARTAIGSGLPDGMREPEYPDPKYAARASTQPVTRKVGDAESASPPDEGPPAEPPADFVDEPPPPSGRPTVKVNNRQLRDVTADFHRALVDANRPPVVFARAGALARVRRDEKGSPVVDTIGETVLRHRVARTCNTIRLTKDGDEVQVAPPLDAVRDLLASADWDDLPPLEAVTEIPTLRPDGTIHDQAGYDRATRLLYVPVDGVEIPAVADSPTTADSAAALVVIDELLCDFRFGTDTDRANAIGMLLTPLVRPAIVNAQVPLALLDAPEPGTGKGLLADLVSLIATGRDTAVKSLPKQEEEIRKTITATLIEGHTIVVLDNIEDAIRSSALAAALTASTWSDRILGRSETVTVPNRATWIATGNNLQVAGDLARRCYHIRLDARQARPWERTDFKHPDLRGWTRANRGRLLWALLTLARAWWTAGQPPADVPILGGFTPWAKTIGGILAHAGLEGFLSNIFEFMATADSEASEWEAFLVSWHHTFGTEIVTVARLKIEISSIGAVPMRDALPSKLIDVVEKNSFSKVLGNQLRSHAGRHYGTDGYRLIRQENDAHTRTARWSVERTREEPANPANVLDLRGSRSSAGLGHANAMSDTEQETFHMAVGETKPAKPREPRNTLMGTCKRCGDPADDKLCGRCRRDDQTF